MQRHTAASYTDVQDMAEALRLSETAFERAQDIAGLTADRQDWLHYIDRFLVAVGALLILSGVAAFFAWNWAELGHLAMEKTRFQVAFDPESLEQNEDRSHWTDKGLERAEFARLGGIHRNTFIQSPKLLDGELRLKVEPRLRFAGQITGVEG